MKNNIIPFLLGVILTTLISADKFTEILTIKPALPKESIAFTTNYQSVANHINKWSKKGFIVKHVSGIPDRYEGYNYVTVIMEKY